MEPPVTRNDNSDSLHSSRGTKITHSFQSWLCCFAKRQASSQEEPCKDDRIQPATKRQKQQEQQQQPKRQTRVNRPGYNSYLKVLLDENAMEHLHGYAVEIQKRLDTMEKHNDMLQSTRNVLMSRESSSPNDDSGKDEQGLWQPITAKRTKILRFKPRKKESLHMTFFFGGETLCEIPAPELIHWHSRITERLSQSGFCLTKEQEEKDVITGKASHKKSEKQGTNDDFSFQIQGLTVFPPQRNNLVVAILAPSVGNPWNDLYQDIRTISQDETCSKDLSEACKFSKDEWIPHVTLGNLIGGSKQKNKELVPLLEEVFQAAGGTDMDEISRELTSHGTVGWHVIPLGIGMGGPCPQQASLDWNFKYIESKGNG
jgi:2'-5' RNA ligase